MDISPSPLTCRPLKAMVPGPAGCAGKPARLPLWKGGPTPVVVNRAALVFPGQVRFFVVSPQVAQDKGTVLLSCW